MTASLSLTPGQEQAASRIDALDLAPVVLGLMHPDPGLTVMSLAEADQVVTAYRAWLKLCAWYPGEPLIPAVPVDEAWQAHLADTAKYARDCQAAFGTFAHRYPYHWRDTNWVAWHRDYARTCDLFREHFGTGMPGTATPADEDFHPDAECCTGGAGSTRVFGDLSDPGAAVLDRERPRPPRAAPTGPTRLPALAGRTVLSSSTHEVTPTAREHRFPMVSNVAGSKPDLRWLLENLVARVPHASSAMMLSADGLAAIACGLDRDRADQLAVIAASLFSAGKAAGAVLCGNRDVRQVAVELDGPLLFVSSAGKGSLLAVTTGREADAQVVGYEMKQLVKSIQPFLAIPARLPGAGPGRRDSALAPDLARRRQ